MKLHYTHHPIFNALRRLSRISGRVMDDKVVQHLRLLGPKEVYEVYNEIHVFADKLERFFGFANTRYPTRGTTNAVVVSAYEIQMSTKIQAACADSRKSEQCLKAK